MKARSLFLVTALLFCINLNARDVEDIYGKTYRNPKLSLFDNTMIARDMLRKLSITQGTMGKSEGVFLYRQKEHTFYQEQINKATKTIELNINRANIESVRNESKIEKYSK